jgi:hypothetical protein
MNVALAILSFFASAMLQLTVVPFVWLKTAKCIRIEKNTKTSIVDIEKYGASLKIYVQEHLLYDASALRLIKETHFVSYLERMSKQVLSWSNILRGSLRHLLASVGIWPDTATGEHSNTRRVPMIEMKNKNLLR